MQTNYPVIRIEGTAYQRGVQHGQLAKTQIDACVDIYRSAFEQTAGLGWEEVCDRTTTFKTQIQTFDTEMIKEIEGIAHGSKHPIEHIVAINCRTEILFEGYQKNRPIDDPSADECTTIGVTPRAAARETTIIGKNWDRWDTCQEAVVILQVLPDVGPAFVTVVEAGMLGRDGINELGIAVCGNLLRSVEDGTKTGVPVPLIRRRILNSVSMVEALDSVIKTERGASTNYVIAHKSGIVINIEATPSETFITYPERGLLTHSNHFTALAAQVKGVDRGPSSDSLYRIQRVRDLLEPQLGSIDIDQIIAALSDHAAYPHSVCRHPDENRPRFERSASIASIVMDLSENKIRVSSGNPCSNAFQEVAIPERGQGVSTQAVPPTAYSGAAR